MPSPLCFSLHLSQASLRHAAHPRGHHCALHTDLFLEDITCPPPTSSLHDPRDQPPEDLLTYLNPNPAPSMQTLGPMPVFAMTKNHLDTLESQVPSMQRWKQAQGGEVASPKASEGFPRAQTQKPLKAVGTLTGDTARRAPWSRDTPGSNPSSAPQCVECGPWLTSPSLHFPTCKMGQRIPM